MEIFENCFFVVLHLSHYTVARTRNNRKTNTDSLLVLIRVAFLAVLVSSEANYKEAAVLAGDVYFEILFDFRFVLRVSAVIATVIMVAEAISRRIQTIIP
ncbi:unnamed protein product [Amaranthus hypochondriacus]